jgi:hypothetical protein
VKVEPHTSQPSAALIDSQSVRAAETVGRASRGDDVGKNVNGRKRHIVTDTCGLLLAVAVTGANVQDRDAARPAAVGATVLVFHHRAGLGRRRLYRPVG